MKKIIIIYKIWIRESEIIERVAYFTCSLETTQFWVFFAQFLSRIFIPTPLLEMSFGSFSLIQILASENIQNSSRRSSDRSISIIKSVSFYAHQEKKKIERVHDSPLSRTKYRWKENRKIIFLIFWRISELQNLRVKF